MNQNAFITIDKDGTVKVNGGLIFCNGYLLNIDPDLDFNKFNHEITNNCLISNLPKWYQFWEWLRILRLIRMYTKSI